MVGKGWKISIRYIHVTEIISVSDVYTLLKYLKLAKACCQTPGRGGWQVRNPLLGVYFGVGPVIVSLPLYAVHPMRPK
jgi:hypothetical protein